MRDDRDHSYHFDLEKIGERHTASEQSCISALLDTIDLDSGARALIVEQAVKYAEQTRMDFAAQSTVDHLLQEYGLATEEGVELMRLCEALIRTPDFATARLLVRDKFLNADWASHAGGSSHFLVNRATNGLQVAQSWIQRSGGKQGRSLAAKIGDYPLAVAVLRTMRLLGGHFVFAQSIGTALKKARKTKELFSFDMLGEAAYTEADSEKYFDAYLGATRAIVEASGRKKTVSENHGISVKLSALHPRYEYAKRDTCVPVIARRLVEICKEAKRGNIGVTIDAEETERLEVSLLVMEQLLAAPELADWDGLGIVVQAYQRRASRLVEELIRLSKLHRRRLCVRLVKGAYWDSEIKRAQELGLESYPVFTRRATTDLSYLGCAKLLLDTEKWIYPQFASHNAHTLAAIQHLAGDFEDYEFQRLHGMGETLHDAVVKTSRLNSRIYAPIGNYHDLLPYLVRRLIENGANSSFLNQLMNEEVTLAELVKDPVAIAMSGQPAQHPKIPDPRDICGGARLSGLGVDTTQQKVEAELSERSCREQIIEGSSIIGGQPVGQGAEQIFNPARRQDCVGEVSAASVSDVDKAVGQAHSSTWASSHTPEQRASILRKAADLLELEMEHFLDLCVREAGKSFVDAIAEVREAVDFCRYYADECVAEKNLCRDEIGVVACISPWNFPLAIFMGQIVAALSVGNRVVAKPAPQTPLIAYQAVRLLHRAGIPVDALHLVHGPAQEIGNSLTGHPNVSGVCFTGSTRTAKTIAARLAETGRADAPLIAETGGINAMIVDSTALIEQAVDDVITSAFQSAGQRCSACRLVCVQDDIYIPFKAMLIGAMNALKLGDPAQFDTDVGPVIDEIARSNINAYIEHARERGTLLHKSHDESDLHGGHFVSPSLIEVTRISDLEQEVFGPVLHLVRYAAEDFDQVITQINELGYGLTLGLHSRLDGRARDVARTAKVGNFYVNRNQIGAVVGVQPFGGEGLSGTGPKAGGPHYLTQLTRAPSRHQTSTLESKPAHMPRTSEALKVYSGEVERVRNAQAVWSRGFGVDERKVLLSEAFRNRTDLDVGFWNSLNIETNIKLPGPTGESNELQLYPRGVLLCLGDSLAGTDALFRQMAIVMATGSGVVVTDDQIDDIQFDQLLGCLKRNCIPSDLIHRVPKGDNEALADMQIDGVVADGLARVGFAPALKVRRGAILPLLSSDDPVVRFFHERTVTINTTAAGGNASLLTLE